MEKLTDPKKFAHDLSRWYRLNRRDLPFRHRRDPYEILVSELMLQQTQIATMLPYYERFMQRFPDVNTLADAPFETVLKMWEGLGYYSRARYLHETARTIVYEYGAFPDTFEEMKKLKGVGRYTAGAILSIAFEKPIPAVDGNVMRVMSRILLYEKDVRKVKHMREIEDVLKTPIAQTTPSDFTQGLMEVGALICLKRPRCGECPLPAHCFAYKQKRQDEFPFKSASRRKTHEHYITLLVDAGNGYFLRKRPKAGLLANMYEFPQYTGTLEQAIGAFEEDYGVKLSEPEFMQTFTHTFTHKVWHMHVYKASSPRRSPFAHALATFPHAISRAHRKIIDALEE